MMADMDVTRVRTRERIIRLVQCRGCSRQYLCEYAEIFKDNTKETYDRLLGPLEPDEAQAILKGIASCPDPMDMLCECRIHREMGALTERLPVCGPA